MSYIQFIDIMDAVYRQCALKIGFPVCLNGANCFIAKIRSINTVFYVGKRLTH